MKTRFVTVSLINKLQSVDGVVKLVPSDGYAFSSSNAGWSVQHFVEFGKQIEVE